MLVVLLLFTLGLGGVSSAMTSQNCSSVVDMVLESAYSGVGWAVEMVDASSKPPTGILWQRHRLLTLFSDVPFDSSRYIGNYDQCLALETTKDFGTLYCTADLQVQKIGHVSKSPPSRVFADICVPDICTEKDMVPVLQHHVRKIPYVNAVVHDVKCFEKEIPFTYKAIFAICVLSVLLLAIAAGTIYDLIYIQDILAVFKDEETTTSTTPDISHVDDPDATKIDESDQRPMIKEPHTVLEVSHKPGNLGQVLMSFSLYTNISNMMSTHQSKGSIPCINGIRVLATTWIIWGHTYAGGEFSMENVKLYLEKAQSRWSFQPNLHYSLAVDTFFVISGLLSTYNTMRKLQIEKPTLQFFKRLFFHRYWRLTPPYALWMLTYVALFKYISDGPLWPQKEAEINECEQSWWKNVLYISTFWGFMDICMPWTWSLSLEMQFYVISPLIILALFYLGWRGIFVPLGMMAASMLYSGIVTFKYHLPPNIEPTLTLFDYFHMYYMNPFGRIGPYLVGMMAGYLLYRTDRKIKLSKRFVIVGWVLSITAIIGVFASLYGHYNGQRLSDGMSALFNSLHRIVWATVFAWVIFACTCGYGGIVNKILSWSAFVPLACVSYLTFLTNLVVIRYYFSSQRRLFYLNDINITFACVACVGVSTIVASIAYLMFEAPFSNLEKAIWIIRNRKKTKLHQN